MVRRQVVGGDDAVWIDHDGKIRESEKAVLYDFGGDHRWIPRSVIIDEGDEVLGVEKWWAAKNGIEGDW